MPQKKSLGLTYLLWFFGGVFGLHHFYLGRDIQGFLWWCTLGGYVGGWLRDLFFIPEYIRAANNDADYLKRLSEKMRCYRTPPFSTWRFCGTIFVSYLWGSVVHSAIPKEDFAGRSWTGLYIFVPLGCALGVWCVGNIGHEEGAFKWPLLGAYAMYPFYKYYPGEVSFTGMIMASAYAFEWKSKQWRRHIKGRKNILRRTTILMMCGCLYVALWGCNLYFNGTITDAEGDEIPISEVVHHFFTSRWWTQLGQSLQDTINFAREHGWREVWKMAVEMLDPHGEQNAYSVLGLDLEANQTMINSKCRQLSKEWHPDKAKDPDTKKLAQERFYEVQQACELLSASKAKRRKRNKKSQG
uniref:DnaJ homolog subfamily C member 22 n=2 Tax=Lygus hesperus TaxID=30085 RepID=A0A0A9Z0Q6_LYGHE